MTLITLVLNWLAFVVMVILIVRARNVGDACEALFAIPFALLFLAGIISHAANRIIYCLARERP